MGEQQRRGAQSGATSVEYAILIGLVAVAIMTAVSALGSSLFTDEVEVLGNVLEREAPDDDPDAPGGPGGGPPCSELPDTADPEPCE